MMRASIRSAAFLLLCTSFADAQPAQMVVLESNSARYPAGQVFDVAVRITLAAGEFVAFATEDARLFRVDGPHDGPAIGGPAPDEGAARRALDELIGAEQPQVGGVGGVRGDLEDDALAQDTRPDPWLVHAQRSGDQCVLRGRNVWLWRESVTDASVAELSASPDDDSLVNVRWSDGEQRAAWPAAVPLTDNIIYELRPRGSQRSVSIRLHLLASGIADNNLAAAVWLAARGCTDQVHLLMR